MLTSKFSQITLCVSILFFTCASNVMASEIPNTFLKKFTISGGASIELPVTDKGIPPATADGVKVEVAGPLFGPSKKTSGNKEMIWAFSISVQPEAKYKSITIDNVSGEKSENVATQENPKVNYFKARDGKEFHILQVRGTATDISQETTPWVFQPDTSTLIFKITLENESGKSIQLYQATQFPESTKLQIQKMLK